MTKGVLKDLIWFDLISESRKEEVKERSCTPEAYAMTNMKKKKKHVWRSLVVKVFADTYVQPLLEQQWNNGEIKNNNTEINNNKYSLLLIVASVKRAMSGKP